MFWPVADRRPAARQHRPVPFSMVRNRLLFLCAFAVAGGLAQTAQPDDQSNRVSGTVINAVTKAPIPRALVFSSDNRLAKLTDGEGHFEFTVPGDESRMVGSVMTERPRLGGCSGWLQARKPGFLDPCSESGWVNRPSEDDFTIPLVPEAIINGRVTLADSDDTLSGTEVRMFFREVMDGLPRWIPRYATRTNSAGEFRFAELPAGEYKLLTQERPDNDPIASIPGKMYGYPPVFYGGAADFASIPTIRLSAGQTFEADFSLARQPYYGVNIPISNEDISSGVQVTVQAQTGPGYSLGYNAGTRQIEGFLPNGNYVVEGTAYGANAASGTVTIRVNGSAVQGPPMTLVPGSSITLDVREQFADKTWTGSGSWGDGKRTFTLHGRRLYLQARLETVDELQPTRGGSLRPPSGPNDDTLVLENVTPGRYWLRLSTGRGYVASARMGDVDLLRQPLVVTPGLSAPIEIDMRDDSAEIDGSVTNLPSSTIGAGSQSSGWSAWIYCVPLPDSPGEFRDLMASQDGHFNYAMMTPGAYRILAFASPQNHLPYRDSEAMKAYEAKGPVVHLSAGQKLNLQVALIRDNDSPEK